MGCLAPGVPAARRLLREVGRHRSTRHVLLLDAHDEPDPVREYDVAQQSP
jgi:hypothetical protein